MSDNKKYYYLKLKENFFDTEDMKLLQGMKEGYIYSDILLKLYLRSLRQDGRLMYRDIIPYTPDMIATITNHQVGTVEKAIGILKQMGFIEILDNGAIYMADIQNFIGQSSSEADRIRDYRKSINAEKSRISQSTGVTNEITNAVQMYDESTPEIRDKSIEINNRSINTSIARSSEKQTSELQEKPFITLQLNTGQEHPIYDKEIKDWEELYPAVDVRQQLRAMKGWLLSNPGRRKTKRGINRFINNWLSKKQDRGYRKPFDDNGHQRTLDSGYGDRLNELVKENRG